MRRNLWSSFVNSRELAKPMLRAVLAVIAFAVVVTAAHLLEGQERSASLPTAAAVTLN